LSSVVPEHSGQGQNSGGGGSEDMASPENGGGQHDGGGVTGNDHDLAGVGANVDLAGVAPGTLTFGQVCSTGTDCATGFCEPANMGANLECTQQCTNLGLADPTCPNQANGSAGFCNMKGFCKP
jgi:hypothetical protein